MDSFATLRAILGSGSSPIDCDDQRSKLTNKRKAAFEAWHQKKLAQMKSGDASSEETTNSELKRCLLSPPTLPVSIDAHSFAAKGKIEQGEGAKGTSGHSATAAAKTLTTPKLSRHNDAAFYPNIQCILCHEWVCSRNRYMHIESHFQYRPYKCSVCGYDNRKQIFIELHISRVHKGAAQILYNPDSELEKRAWAMAERCLQHTREVLLRRQMDNVHETDPAKPAESKQPSPGPATKPEDAPPILAPYTGVYRPKIYNNQRSEKSNLIEESRMLGLIPDLSEVTAREERCRLCDSHVLRTPSLLEEHARTHLSRPSYSCSVTACNVVHHSRNFITRHMKEVHRIRKRVSDLLDRDRTLFNEYLTTCCRCFPQCFAGSASGLFKDASAERPKMKCNSSLATCQSSFSSDTIDRDQGCFGCAQGLRLFPEITTDEQCICCCSVEDDSNKRFIIFCRLCNEMLSGADRLRLFHQAESHSLKHCLTMPFQCVQCPFSHWRKSEFELHFRQSHNENESLSAFFRWQTIVDWRRMWRSAFDQCFSQPKKPDEYAQCRICTAKVIDSIDDRFQHSLLSHCPNFIDHDRSFLQCAYCPDFNENVDTSISDHTAQSHSDQPVIKCFAIHFTSDACTAMKSIRNTYDRCFEITEESPTDTDTLSSSSSNTTYCHLCHSAIADDPQSQIAHLQYHSTTPIYRCRACSYRDIDVDRMKRHVDDKHEGKVPYYAETLPRDHESKNVRFMDICSSRLNE